MKFNLAARAMYAVLWKPTMAKNCDCPDHPAGALQPGSFNDENEGFASKEAESIYDEVFFFTDERTLQLPENELVAELKKDNPDWFE